MGDLISKDAALVFSKHQLSVAVNSLPLFPIITFVFLFMRFLNYLD